MSAIEDEVCRKLQERAAHGLQKYGVTVERTDLTRVDWLRHAQEEALDLAVYLQRVIDPWRSIDSAPTDGTWFVARGETQYGYSVYPCAFDADIEVWVGLVDLMMVRGVQPNQWKPLA